MCGGGQGAARWRGGGGGRDDRMVGGGLLHDAQPDPPSPNPPPLPSPPTMPSPIHHLLPLTPPPLLSPPSCPPSMAQGVLDVAWLPDGLGLFVCSYDGTVMACRFSEEELGESGGGDGLGGGRLSGRGGSCGASVLYRPPATYITIHVLPLPQARWPRQARRPSCWRGCTAATPAVMEPAPGSPRASRWRRSLPLPPPPLPVPPLPGEVPRPLLAQAGGSSLRRSGLQQRQQAHRERGRGVRGLGGRGA